MKRIYFLLIIFALVFIFQEIKAEENLNNLIVYGEGFSFRVEEPDHWKGDTENADKLGANIIFYRDSETLETVSVLIRVSLYPKVDENTSEDLAYDMNQYKKKNPEIKFKDLQISHPKYPTFPKIYFVPEKKHDYVVFLNPGKDIDKIFSVSMMKQKGEATEEELAAFKHIVESLLFLTKSITIR